MVKLLILKANNNKGFVLITVIWLIALMSVIALGGVILSSNEYKISMDQVKLKQAYYLAEAGLEEGLNTLRVNPAQEISIQENLDGTITVKQQGDLTERIKLEAIGTSGDIKKTLSLELEFNFLNKQYPVLIELSDLNLSSSDIPMEIYKNIFCEGNLSLENYGIMGNLYCLGKTELAQGSSIVGDIYIYDGLSLREASFIKGKVFIKKIENVFLDDSSFIEGEIIQWDGKAPIKIINFQEK
ncbi:MAG: hypothetical protein GX923_02165 [Clostridia bacterium]|jgi:hypothetical protein|nr:hypothetical protein [Clostridia bacterium]